MTAVVVEAFESFFYNLPCFPIVDVRVRLTRVRLCSVNALGQLSAQFDGFVRPSLLKGVALPQTVTPVVSFDIEVRCHASAK